MPSPVKEIVWEEEEPSPPASCFVCISSGVSRPSFNQEPDGYILLSFYIRASNGGFLFYRFHPLWRGPNSSELTSQLDLFLE